MQSSPFSSFLLCFGTFTVHIYLFKATKLPGGGCKQADALLSMMAENLASGLWKSHRQVRHSWKSFQKLHLSCEDPSQHMLGGQAEETMGAKWNLLCAR